MFTRKENMRQFLRYYPGVSGIAIICLILYLLTAFPLFPGKWLFNLLGGVNLYISNGEWWRLFTPILLHVNFTHLLFNCFSLIILAPAVETILGTRKFLLFFFLSGILANVITYLIMPLTYTHVGASGSIFSLFGLLVYIAIYRKHTLSKQDRQLILTLTTIAVVTTFIQPNINIIGHVSGLIIGLILAPVFLTFFRKNNFTLR